MCMCNLWLILSRMNKGADTTCTVSLGRVVVANKAPTNARSYYFQFVVNFLRRLMDTRSTPVRLEGNYWSLLPLVSASICWSAHESPTTWIIVRKWPRLFLMMFEPRRKDLLLPLTVRLVHRATVHSPRHVDALCLFICGFCKTLAQSRTSRVHNNRSNFDNDAVWIVTRSLLRSFAKLCLVSVLLQFSSVLFFSPPPPSALRRDGIISPGLFNHAQRKNAIKVVTRNVLVL